jgi:hypothetical protein
VSDTETNADKFVRKFDDILANEGIEVNSSLSMNNRHHDFHDFRRYRASERSFRRAPRTLPLSEGGVGESVKRILR